MSVGLLLLTHNYIGEELLETARTTLGDCPLPSRSLCVSADADPDRIAEQSRQVLKELDNGEGILILTDAYGSTPCNIATHLSESVRTAVVSGLNLPMLLRVLNYPHLSLEELQRKAVSGGRDGVILIECTKDPLS